MVSYCVLLRFVQTFEILNRIRSSKLLSRLAAVAPHEPQSSQTPPRKETKATKEAKVTQETGLAKAQMVLTYKLYILAHHGTV